MLLDGYRKRQAILVTACTHNQVILAWVIPGQLCHGNKTPFDVVLVAMR